MTCSSASLRRRVAICLTAVTVALAMMSGLPQAVAAVQGHQTTSYGVLRWASRASLSSSPDSAIRIWTPANEHPPVVTLDSATRTALTHDVITALPNTYRSYVTQMRAANPRLRLFVYTNGMFAQPNQGSLYPDSWYARDALGRKIQSNGFGNFLMDPRSPGWQANRVAFCQAALIRSGYDGCMLDMLGGAPLDPAYGSGVPMDTSTGATFTGISWLQATNEIARQVEVGSGLPVVGNGGGSGLRYWNHNAPTSILLGGTDDLISETWLQTSSQALTVFPSEAKWKASVDELVDAASRGKTSLAMVKLWAPGTQAEKDRWHQFALASFLLGTDGSAMFNASFDRTGDPSQVHPWWSAPIGMPTEPYRAAGSVYTRGFTNGLVVVNASPTSVEVPLGQTYRTLDGQLVTSLTLKGQNGAVLVYPSPSSTLHPLHSRQQGTPAIAYRLCAPPCASTVRATPAGN